jgi:hypothetical protein
MNTRYVLAAAATLALVASTALAAQAAPSGVATHSGSFSPPPSPLGTYHASVGTVINEGFGVSLSLPSGTLTNTDPLTRVKCTSADGCTLILRLWGQFISSADGQAAFCPMIDGNQPNIACSYLGKVHSADSYTHETVLATYQIAQGQHQVRTQAYLAGSGVLYSYHYEYEVTTP